MLKALGRWVSEQGAGSSPWGGLALGGTRTPPDSGMRTFGRWSTLITPVWPACPGVVEGGCRSAARSQRGVAVRRAAASGSAQADGNLSLGSGTPPAAAASRPMPRIVGRAHRHLRRADYAGRGCDSDYRASRGKASLLFRRAFGPGLLRASQAVEVPHDIRSARVRCRPERVQFGGTADSLPRDAGPVIQRFGMERSINRGGQTAICRRGKWSQSPVSAGCLLIL